MRAPEFDGTQPCATIGGDLWFPDPGSWTDFNKKAKDLCFTCEFRKPCLEYALSFPSSMEGIWGGTTAKERKKIRQEMRKEAAA